MSMTPRKLLPTWNQTADCHDVCDSTCPHGCYPYSDMNYYIPPPQGSINKEAHNISPYIIISVALLASLFLLISYYLIIVRNCSNWNRRRPSHGEEFTDENRGPVIDHPIWYINTVGLQPSLINLITNFKYKKGDGLIDETECSVCLNEFQDDDSLRLLPKCNHAFHIHCIDMWLRSHTNCPLCRSAIISSATTADPVGSLSSSSDMSSDGLQLRVQVTSSNIDEEFQDNVRRDQNEFEGPPESLEKQGIRRCVSVDSLMAASIGLQTVAFPNGVGEKRKIGEMCSGSSLNLRVQRVMESAASMKRSFSYNGKPFCFRNHRNPSSLLDE